MLTIDNITAFEAYLYNTARKVLRDDCDIRDAIQATYVKAIEKLDTLQDESKLRSWLGMTCHNAAIDMVRKQAKGVDSLGDYQPGKEDSDSLEMSELCETIETALAGFCQRDIAVYEMLVYGHKPREIADRLGITSNNVSVIVHRLRKAIAKAIGTA